MNLSGPNEEKLPSAISDAAIILIELTISMHDWHREFFQSALNDLLQQLRVAPSSIRNVRCLLTRELDVPYCQKWRVSEMEYEKRRMQVFLSLRELSGSFHEASRDGE